MSSPGPILAPLLAIAAAYLIGGIPFGYLLVKWKSGADVRAFGSGNIGATNVLRTSGRLTGLLTLLLDAAKGYLAMYMAARLTGWSELAMSAAAVAALLGHMYTPFLRFKGGKGVATFAGVFLYLTPAALGALVVIFVVAVYFTRHISMGSILCAITFPLGVWLIEHAPLPVLGAALASCALVLYRHKDNFERLRAGTERVFSWSSAKRK